jgi:hypothetical protein
MFIEAILLLGSNLRGTRTGDPAMTLPWLNTFCSKEKLECDFFLNYRTLTIQVYLNKGIRLTTAR